MFHFMGWGYLYVQKVIRFHNTTLVCYYSIFSSMIIWVLSFVYVEGCVRRGILINKPVFPCGSDIVDEKIDITFIFGTHTRV